MYQSVTLGAHVKLSLLSLLVAVPAHNHTHSHLPHLSEEDDSFASFLAAQTSLVANSNKYLLFRTTTSFWKLCTHHKYIPQAMLIVKDSERNYSMGSLMDGTHPQSEDLIEIVKSKTICNAGSSVILANRPFNVNHTSLVETISQHFNLVPVICIKMLENCFIQARVCGHVVHMDIACWKMQSMGMYVYVTFVPTSFYRCLKKTRAPWQRRQGSSLFQAGKKEPFTFHSLPSQMANAPIAS